MKKMAKYMAIFLLIYPFGVLLAITFMALRLLRFFHLKNWKRFPHFKEGIIVVANHPSIIDEFFVVMLFFKGFLLSPLRYGPILVADQGNFYNSWYFFWLRPFMISVKREDHQSEAKALLKMEEAIKRGRIVIIFAEGGRTFKGKAEDFRFSEKGKKIRKFKNGIGLLIRKTKALVLPIWIEDTDKFFLNSKERLFSFMFRMVSFSLKIGKLVHFQEGDLRRQKSKQITQVVEDTMLELADE